MIRLARFALATFLLFAPVTLSAWSPASNERIAKKAADLAPPDLAFLIKKYSYEHKRGLTNAALNEETEGHTYFVLSRRGQLRTQIESEVAAAIRMVRTHQPLDGFVEKLGRIAHLVGDANNPFHVSNSDARLGASHEDFEGYFDRRLLKFATVFYGLEANFRLSPYLDSMFGRSASFYPLLATEYFRFGERRTSVEFDDRSTAFGIAALSYSHAVSDLVNIYYYIWKEAGGDVRTARAMSTGNLLLNTPVRP